METFRQDIRFGARSLMRSPAFSAVAIMTLALGIGANTAIFSVINAVMLRPLPAPHADRLVHIGSPNADISNSSEWKRQARSYEEFAPVDYVPVTLSGEEGLERFRGMRAAPEFFLLLGMQPVAGRVFLAEDAVPGAEPVAILSQKFWQKRSNAQESAVGGTLVLDDRVHTIVGVFPDFELLSPYEDVDVILPLATNFRAYMAVARLRPGVTVAAAKAEAMDIAMRLPHKRDLDADARGVYVRSYKRFGLFFETEFILYLLAGAVGFVLMIACVNVANLLFARAAGRGREVAIRNALGAGRARLVGQLLTESLILSTASTALALLFAQWCTSFLLFLMPYRIPRIGQTSLDAAVFTFAALLAVVTATICGLAPALQATRMDLTRALREGAQGARGSARQSRLRSVLVVAEVALAMVLLTGAGLFVKAFLGVRPADPGFDPSNKLTLRANLPRKLYPQPHQQASFVRDVSERIASLPGVLGVAATSRLPFLGFGGYVDMGVDGHPAPPAYFQSVSPSYFRVMGMPLVAGRDFNEADREGRPDVAVINQTMARRFWPDDSPLGRQLKIMGKELTVVGIVRDTRSLAHSSTPASEFYVPYDQSPDGFPGFVVYSTREPAALAPAMRAAVRAVDPNVLVTDIQTFDKILNDAVANPRFNATLLGLLAALALLLAAGGIYSVIAFSVAQRTSEIGVRMALGALPSDVMRLMMRNVLPVVAVGVAIGLGGAWALMRYFGSKYLFSQVFLKDVSPTDPATFVTVTLLWFALAALACYVPARRAMCVDPMVALRHE